MMKRSDCTLENMKALGWEVANDPEVVEILLKEARQGAEARKTRLPENGVYIAEVEDEDSCTYYPRYHTERYYIERAEIKLGNQFVVAMQRKKVESSYRTRQQMYMGD